MTIHFEIIKDDPVVHWVKGATNSWVFLCQTSPTDTTPLNLTGRTLKLIVRKSQSDGLGTTQYTVSGMGTNIILSNGLGTNDKVTVTDAATNTVGLAPGMYDITLWDDVSPDALADGEAWLTAVAQR